MKTFKQFLLERSFSPLSDENVSDADFYGEHKERSPEEFGKFIESLTSEMSKKDETAKSILFHSFAKHPWITSRQDNTRQLDYHISNPNLTDEHLQHAIPHLLNYA